jgi:cellulose synthase operon protein C
LKRKSIQLLAPFKAVAVIITFALASSGCERFAKDDKPEQKASSHIERAESYRQQGQYRAAIIEARNAIDAAPHDTRGILELATLLNDLNQGKQALRVLEPLANNSDRAVVVARADALLAQGKFRSALDYLQAHRSDDDTIQMRIAQAQASLGQTTEAAAAFIALENSSQAATAKLQLARLRLQQGDSEAANGILQQILQKDPNHIDALVLSAKQAELRGDLENAEALLSKALVNLPQTDIITPQKASVLQHLMPILTKLGRSSESLIYAKVLADADPQGAILQNKLKQGVEAFKADKFDEAENLLTEVYEQTHDDYAGILLGMIKYSKKDYSGAATYLAENADPEIAPDSALKALANSEMQLGQPGKLLELISPEEREHIKDPELKALIGIALVQSGKSTTGEKMLVDALQESPTNTAVRATLARHYLIGHQHEKAISTLEEGLARKTDNGLQRLLVGAYIVAGKSDMAMQVAHKLAETKPEQAVNYYVLGHTALIAQQYTVCDTALQKALSLQANYVPALLDSAQLNLIRHQPQPAAKIYQQLITANTANDSTDKTYVDKSSADNTTALKGFITAQEMLGAKATGNDIENQLLQLTNSDTARAVIAEYYLRNQRRDDATRILSAIDATPGNNYPAYVKQLYALAEASDLLKQKEFKRARQAALEGLRFNSRNIDLLAVLSHIEIASGSTKEAAKIIEQLAQIAPNSLTLINLRATLALATGDTTNASQQFRALWAAAKTDQTANKLYQALAKIDPPSATQFLAEWQTALPNSDSPLLLLAMQYQRGGDTQQAQKFYEATLQKNANNPLALNNLAILYFESSDKRALGMAEKAYALQPKNPAVLDTYGWLLVNDKQQGKGVEILEQARALAPNSQEIIKHLEQARSH